jgi:hypothetical protein
MRRQRWWISLPFALLAVAPATALRGAEIPRGVRAFAVNPKDSVDDAAALAATIDRYIAAKWDAAKVEPAPPAEDSEFLRRVYLDVTGKVPTVAAARDFLDDPDPHKRRKVVETLLNGHGYSAHQANIWKGLLLPEVSNNFQVQYLATDFDIWLRQQFEENVGFDKMVREILTASVTSTNGGFGPQAKPTPLAFYYAKDGKSENVAAASARVFLGIRVECAQCHDHPFARWKREQFWGMAAFFSSVQRQGQGGDFFQIRDGTDKHEIAIAGTKKVVKAMFLDGREPEWPSDKRVKGRTVLADWLTAPENPYFARAAVNRTWAQFFGTGLVDPIDDMDKENKASHPELLDEMARQFAAHKFDPKFLIRAITSSRAYSLASTGYSPGQDDPKLFARMAVRGLSPNQLYDSFIQATGINREAEMPPFFFAESPRKDFLERFAEQDTKPTEHQTSILQALTLMNGRLVTDATSLEKGMTLAAIADYYPLSTGGKVETLYLAALGRKPRPEEMERMVEYVERGGPTLNPKKALSDVMWALLNSAEFTLNH